MKQIYKAIVGTIISYYRFFRIFFLSKSKNPYPTSKHLLLLAWAFPPDITGGVYRPASIVHKAKAMGWRVTVICGHPSSNVSSAGIHMETYVANADRVIRLPYRTYEPSYKLFFPKINGDMLNALDTIEITSKLLHDDHPSIVLASGPPFHNFVAARIISKIFKKPYILDYRDEWTECPFDFVETGNLDKYYENKCIENASKVIFTTKSHLEHQLACFKTLKRENSIVIPNGWESGDMPLSSTVNPLAPAGMRIAFVGHLGEHTLPREFLRTLERVLDGKNELLAYLKISFIGSKSTSAIEQLNNFKYKKIIEIYDEVPKPVALKIMGDSDAIIIINEKRLNRYRPGKLYDYISMRTPILVYGLGGEIEDIINDLKVGIVIEENNDSELHEAILKIGSIKTNCFSEKTTEWLQIHTRSILSERIINLLFETEISAL